MSPDGGAPPAGPFGPTRAAAARGAVVLALLGCAAVVGIERLLSRPGFPLAEIVRTTGVGTLLVPVGCVAVFALAVVGYVRSVHSAGRFTLTERGLLVEGSLGSYLLEWRNIREAGAAPGNALGIIVRDREAVLRTHRGTERQRAWLATQEPFGRWDFLYPRAELGRSGAEVLAWIQPYLAEEPQPS